MKIGNLFTLLIGCFFLSVSLYGQQITTNENGQKIIVYPDGSWKYASEEDIQQLESEKEPFEINTSPAKVETNLDKAIQLAELAAAEEADAIKAHEDAKYQRILIEDELNDAEESDEYFEEEIDEIKARLKQAKKKEKKLKSKRKEQSKKAKEASALITMSEEQRAKALKKYLKEEGQTIEEENVNDDQFAMFPTEPVEEEMEDTGDSEPVMSSDQEEQSVKKQFAKYKVENDVYFNPPSEKCELAFNGVDEFSGKKRKDVAKQLLFTYTNEELRSVFKDRDYMECYAYLSSLTGGLTFLTLNIKINSRTAQREYGILEKGSMINIKLLSGENIKLMNSKTNMGTENPLEGSVSYRAQYLVSSGDEKKLKKSEVDKIRIIWSSGYEDYEVYELDFFIDQFKCLAQ